MRIRDEAVARIVSEYWEDKGFTPVISTSVFSLFAILFSKRQNAVVVTNKRFERKVAKWRGLPVIGARHAIEDARRYFAFRDALVLLAKKEVPVYFFNRIGTLKSGFGYSDAAQRRMAAKAGFPVMYEDRKSFEADLKELFGEKYSEEYVDEIGRIPQVVRKGAVYCHEDFASRYVNVVGGLRTTVGQPSRAERTVHVYGRCGAFGYAVEDADTMPSRMQADFISAKCDVRVVNHGLWGGGDDFLDHNFIHDAMRMKKGDVVVFYRKHFEPVVTEKLVRLGLRYFDITSEWHADPSAKGCFYDRPGHMNATGYAVVAKLIASKLIETGFRALPAASDALESFKAEHAFAYLKMSGDADFSEGISEYVKTVRAEVPDNGSSRNGAIVMNCNPFTNGHRKLVETASGEVDRLYVFVVEEDKSFFKFKDRIEMVRRGVEDLRNVVVVPSGRFMISSFTFPEYFMKDYVKEREFDVSSDIRTFCESIAPEFGIRIRFAGEEPFDPVTANYNRSMRDILPQYGMEFREIPRFATADGAVINATATRRMLLEGDFDGLSAYVPDTTLEVLRRDYGNGAVHDSRVLS